MNDRMKFRFWNSVEFIYSHDDFMDNLEAFFCHYQCGSYILNQSTGLFDKNGKLIFEGDIVKAGENCDGCCKDHALNDLTELEIVGNIYENPELKEVE